MAYKLTVGAIKKIVYRIETWSDDEDLSWRELISWCGAGLRIRVSRSALAQCEPVARAFRAKKVALRTAAARLPKVRSITDAAKRIQRLELENKELTQKVQQQNLFIKTLIHNACKSGISKEVLSERLSPINRSGRPSA